MSNRHMVESMNGGRFLNLHERTAWDFFNSLSENSQQWDFSNQREKSSQVSRKGLYEVKDDLDMKSTLATLSRKVDALVMNQSINHHPNVANEVCAICSNLSHTAQNCPSLPVYPDAYSEQVHALQSYEKIPNNPYSPTYNPNWRNHPNFSWKQNQPLSNQGGQQFNMRNQQFVPPNQVYPPAQQPMSQFVAPQQRKPSLEDTLQSFIQSTQQAFQSNTQAILKLEHQLGQLATTVAEREKGKFLSQPIPNPKGVHEVGSSSSHQMRLPFLKSLTLNYVHIDEQILQKFTSECPLLEELSLFSCWGIKYICISKPLKLKTIRIVKTLGEDHLESIKIVAPNLQKISLGFEERQIEPYVLDLSGCLQLIDLEIVGKTFSDQEFHDLISNFPLLENLSLRYCCSLEKIMISSNRLKELCIDSCVNLKAIDLVTPNLLSFTYVSNPVPTFSITASCPWRVAFNYGAADVSWYINIKEFLWASNQIDELTILDSSMRTTFNLEDFQNIPPLPPCGVECLSLYTDALPSKYAALLDGIFWICFPKFLSITSGSKNRNKFIKWLCMELMNEYVYCCNSLRMKCWRHYLKGFVISSSEMKEDNEPVDIDNLLDNSSTRPSETLRFRLEWLFPTYD